MLDQPYNAKNSNFESLEELRLVKGIDQAMLYGQDTNHNGVLDEGGTNGTGGITAYESNQFGLLDYVTAWSHEPNKQADGTARVNVRNPDPEELNKVLTDKLGSDSRAHEILQNLQRTPASASAACWSFTCVRA